MILRLLRLLRVLKLFDQATIPELQVIVNICGIVACLYGSTLTTRHSLREDSLWHQGRMSAFFPF